MYGPMGPGTATALGGGAATLAMTGFNALALVVAAVTLVFAGLAAWKLIPREEE